MLKSKNLNLNLNLNLKLSLKKFLPKKQSQFLPNLQRMLNYFLALMGLSPQNPI
jgi:hypothetical protein